MSIFKQEAQKLIRESLVSIYQMSEELSAQSSLQVIYASDIELAHIAFPCHSLAKQLKKSPQIIANTLVENIQKRTNTQCFAQVVSVSGYVNFFINVEYLYGCLLELTKKQKLLQDFSLNKNEEEILDIEFSQPNTHKALHVGHVRNMIYGDVVCKLLEASGKKVIRSTFPGDLGAHIAKCLWYIQKFKIHEKPKDAQKAKWLGQMYCESDAYLKGLVGKPEEVSVKIEIGNVLKNLENGMGDHYPLYLETREWSLKQMQDTYSWLGIHFDTWYFESECDKPSRELILQKFNEGFFQKSQGAIGIDLSQYDLGFVIFLKSDGTGLYISKDLDLLRRKFSNPQVKSSIVIVDARQKLHFKQLFKTAELMGYPQAKDSIHLAYESVTDENGKAFSSRSLTGISLEDLRRLMIEKVIQAYLEEYRGVWSDFEIEDSAEKIVLGALKYGFLKFDANRIIKFVLDEWIQMEGDTGPYLQYTYARCQSILDKVELIPNSQKIIVNHKTEQELLLFAERFSEIVFQSGREFRPSVLCSYLFDLAKFFNRFYKECPIKTASTPEERNSRLGIVRIFSETLKEGLDLLGIPCLKRL